MQIIKQYRDIYGLLTRCEVKMAGYWRSSVFACLWTETESRSINTQKKNPLFFKGLSNQADVELDMINVLSAADNTFIMSSSQAIVN